jgi:hypothetical protein
MIFQNTLRKRDQMPAIIILNVVLAVLIVAGIVSLLGRAIVLDSASREGQTMRRRRRSLAAPALRLRPVAG